MSAVGQTDVDGSRWYVDPVDPSRRFESVTTILAMASDTAWMGQWSARMAAEVIGERVAEFADVVAALGPVKAARLYRDEFTARRHLKAEIGSYLHSVLEALLLDTPIPDLPAHLVGVEADGERVDIDAIAVGLVNFLTDYNVEPVLAEATVANPIHGYAGTLDLIARLRGLGKRLIDCKTGRVVHDNVPLQLGPYRYSTEVWIDHFGNKTEMPSVDGCGVLHLRRSYRGGYRLLDVDAGPDQFRQFLTLYRAIRVREEIPALPMRVLRAPGQPVWVDEVPGLGRYARALTAAGLDTIADLAAFTAADLRQIKGVGPKAIDAIAAAIAAHPTTTTTTQAEVA